MDIGVRDLKAHLSEHLERVANGEVAIVTFDVRLGQAARSLGFAVVGA